MITVLLLIASNVFMTFAWYGHLKFEQTALWKVILISWLIAGVEYCFAVPANRFGHMAGMDVAQLKIMQEAITLIVFCIFAVTYAGLKLQWNHYVGAGLVLLAVFFVFHKW